MNKDELLKLIQGQLIVSAQALEEEPLYCESMSLMPFMARAAKQAGAVAIRTNSVRDVMGIKNETNLPVIGLIKKQYEGFSQHITVTMAEVDALVLAGADVIALDCTNRPRVDERTVGEFIQAIKEKYPSLILMGDISTFDEGVYAYEHGIDLVGTTLSGYTPYTPKLKGPDYELVQSLAAHIPIPVIAEGRIHTPEEAVKMLEIGAYSVVVGGAITRPFEITMRFIDAIKEG